MLRSAGGHGAPRTPDARPEQRAAPALRRPTRRCRSGAIAPPSRPAFGADVRCAAGTLPQASTSAACARESKHVGASTARAVPDSRRYRTRPGGIISVVFGHPQERSVRLVRRPVHAGAADAAAGDQRQAERPSRRYARYRTYIVARRRPFRVVVRDVVVDNYGAWFHARQRVRQTCAWRDAGTATSRWMPSTTPGSPCIIPGDGYPLRYSSHIILWPERRRSRLPALPVVVTVRKGIASIPGNGPLGHRLP